MKQADSASTFATEERPSVELNKFMTQIKAWSWYLMSMWLFIIIVLILAWPFPCYFGKDWTFISIEEMWNRMTWFYLLFIFLFILATLSYLFWNFYVFKSSSPPSVHITEYKPESSEPLSFLASYFVPLVSFSIDKTNHLIVLIILFLCIGIMFVKGNLFHLNPTLLLIGFNLYEVKFSYQTTNPDQKKQIPEYSKIIIFKGHISVDEDIRYISISSNLWYARKINHDCRKS